MLCEEFENLLHNPQTTSAEFSHFILASFANNDILSQSFGISNYTETQYEKADMETSEKKLAMDSFIKEFQSSYSYIAKDVADNLDISGLQSITLNYFSQAAKHFSNMKNEEYDKLIHNISTLFSATSLPPVPDGNNSSGNNCVRNLFLCLWLLTLMDNTQALQIKLAKIIFQSLIKCQSSCLAALCLLWREHYQDKRALLTALRNHAMEILTEGVIEITSTTSSASSQIRNSFSRQMFCLNSNENLRLAVNILQFIHAASVFCGIWADDDNNEDDGEQKYSMDLEWIDEVSVSPNCWHFGRFMPLLQMLGVRDIRDCREPVLSWSSFQDSMLNTYMDGLLHADQRPMRDTSAWSSFSNNSNHQRDRDNIIQFLDYPYLLTLDNRLTFLKTHVSTRATQWPPNSTSLFRSSLAALLMGHDESSHPTVSLSFLNPQNNEMLTSLETSSSQQQQATSTTAASIVDADATSDSPPNEVASGSDETTDQSAGTSHDDHVSSLLAEVRLLRQMRSSLLPLSRLSQLLEMDFSETSGQEDEDDSDNEVMLPQNRFSSSSSAAAAVHHEEVETGRDRLFSTLFNHRQQLGFYRRTWSITLDRNNLVSSFLSQLNPLVENRRTSELKKPIRVKFHGESGVDQDGGLTKEFFHLIMTELFKVDHGLFTWNDQVGSYWLTNYQDDLLLSNPEYTYVGVLLALAVYHAIPINVALPTVFFRKLLGRKTAFCDLAEVDKTLHSSLVSMMSISDEDEFNDTFNHSFVISLKDAFDCVYEHKLLPNNEHAQMVTVYTCKKYANLYASYLLNDSVEMQFKQIRDGWNLVFESTPYEELLLPHEIRTVILGSQENIDIDQLAEHTIYSDCYSATHPNIVAFWNVVRVQLSPEEHRKLLQFSTASPRLPLGGYQRLKFTIVPAGGETDRLPSAHTCFNTLILPVYTNEEKLHQCLLKAIEHSHGFGLV